MPRTYLAKVKGKPTDETLDKLRERRAARGWAWHAGVRAERFEAAERNTWLKLRWAEGRPHLIKRLCAAVGHPVVRLFRPAQAGVSVAGLQPGELRPLTAEEVQRVEAIAAGGNGSRAGALSAPSAARSGGRGRRGGAGCRGGVGRGRACARDLRRRPACLGPARSAGKWLRAPRRRARRRWRSAVRGTRRRWLPVPRGWCKARRRSGRERLRRRCRVRPGFPGPWSWHRASGIQWPPIATSGREKLPPAGP